MTAAVADGVVLRDLGEHGTVEFDTEKKRMPYSLVRPDGERESLDRVTTILGVLDKGALTRWAEARGAEGAFRAILQGDLSLESPPEDAIETVRALGLGADAAKQRGADRGLDIHAALEYWVEHGDLPPAGELVMDARPYLQGLAKWLVKADPTPIRSEQVVCHPEHGYAGRLDLWCEIGGLTAIVDPKTNEKCVTYDSHHLQVAGYRLAEEFITGERATQAFVLALGPGGLFDAVPCSAEDEDFLAVLDVYRRMKRIRQPLTPARRRRAQEVA